MQTVDSGGSAVVNDSLSKPILTMDGKPWRRFFARSLDAMLAWYVFVLVVLGLMLVLRPEFSIATNIPFPLAFPILLLIFTLGASIPAVLLNAVLLSAVGTTLGKWIFEIRVREMDGQRLTFRRALRREFLVLWCGLGLSLPVLNVFFMAAALGYIEENRETWWDRRMKLAVDYRQGNLRQYALWTVTVLITTLLPGLLNSIALL